jgi:hypothetical protein
MFDAASKELITQGDQTKESTNLNEEQWLAGFKRR